MNTQRLVGAGLLALALVANGCDDNNDPVTPATPTQFTATLLDENERPNPITTTTNANGSATFTVNAAQTEIAYTVTVANTTSPVTVCHIHTGKSDVAGPVLVTLCASGTTAAVTTATQIASGTIRPGTNSTTVGSSPVSIPTLVQMLKNGDVYVNVHTSTNGGGEVRGQTVAVATP